MKSWILWIHCLKLLLINSTTSRSLDDAHFETVLQEAVVREIEAEWEDVHCLPRPRTSTARVAFLKWMIPLCEIVPRCSKIPLELYTGLPSSLNLALLNVLVLWCYTTRWLSSVCPAYKRPGMWKMECTLWAVPSHLPSLVTPTQPKVMSHFLSFIFQE